MKKFCILFFYAGIVMFFANAVSAGGQIPGDVSGDSKVDLSDALHGLQIIEQTDDPAKTINSDADANQDDKIGMEEVLYILQKMAWLRPSTLAETPVIITSGDSTDLGFHMLTGMVSPEVISLSFTLNGGADQAITINDHAFLAQLTLKSGRNSICIKAADDMGTVISDSCTSVVYDPVKLNSTPYSQSRSYVLSGMVSSPDVRSLSFRLNSGEYQAITFQNYGAYAVFTVPGPLSLQPGRNDICIKSADAAGGLINESCYVVLWNPVGITSKDSSLSSNYTLTGTASPEVVSLHYTLNNGAEQAITISQSAISLPLILNPGSNNICLKATDSANLTGNILSEFCYPVDYQPVQFTSSAYSTASNYTLTGTISSAEVTALSWSLNGGTEQLIDISKSDFSLPLTLIPGLNSLCTAIAVSTGSAGRSCMDVTYDRSRASSLDLIGSALKAGVITPETALIYKAYSVFGDAGLPAQYQGDDSLIADYDEVLHEIYSMAPTLSQEGQDALNPFMVPPFYQGSWSDRSKSAQTATPQSFTGTREPLGITPYCNPGWPPSNPCPLSGDWDFVGGNFVKVWYLKKNEGTDKTVAQRIIELMETKEAVWNKLTTYMGRTPMSDENNLFNGDDSRLDISLAEMGGSMKGLTVTRGANFFTAEPVPVYILLNRAQDLNKLLFATVHEFMHAIQYNTNTPTNKDNYFTLMETTAQWAGHSIFATMDPNNKIDQTYLWAYLNNTNQPMDYKRDGRFAYGLYLFPLFLSYTYGSLDTNIIKEIWDFTQTSDQIHAIDRALNKHKTDLKSVWPKFALTVWNQGPVNSFKKWDKIWIDWPEKDSMDWNYETVTPNKIYPFAADLPSYSARYSHFRFTDPNVRSVMFMNGLNFKLTPEPVRTSSGATVTGMAAKRVDDWTLAKGAKVQAIIKKGGIWQTPEDWSLYPFKTFCRDLSAERIEELVIILTAGDNSRKDFSPQGQPPMLYTTDVMCGPGKFSAAVSCDVDSDHKTLNVNEVAYESMAFGPGDGDESKADVTYSPLEMGYRFIRGTNKVGDWNISKSGDGGVNGSGDVKNDHVGLGFHTVNFATPGENSYQAYDVSGSFNGLVYEYTRDCECPGTLPLDCTLTADFNLKSAFDTEKKQYTRHITGPTITGPGSDFSTNAAPLSYVTRRPADFTCMCLCPSLAWDWTCSGNWSLTSTPEP